MPQYKSAGPAPSLLLVSTSLPNRQLSNLKRIKIGLDNICWHIIFALFSQHKFTSLLWCFDYCTLIDALFFGSQDIFDKLQAFSSLSIFSSFFSGGALIWSIWDFVPLANLPSFENSAPEIEADLMATSSLPTGFVADDEGAGSHCKTSSGTLLPVSAFFSVGEGFI